jgi:CO dehydrogenase/acetyl-CoA synthase epsilon subunit
MQTLPRVPASRDPLVDRGALTTRAWFRFFSLLQDSIGQASRETFTLVQNSTGATLFKGTVVGFAGVGAANLLSVSKYLADGSTPSLYILGVLDETIPDSGATGLCSVWGPVTGIDTSAFNVGDILYASPTVAGAFTNVKPTAPDNVIPVAAVLIKSATDGVIFVRPTIEQQKYYGEFTKTTDQTPASTNTAYALTFDNTEIAEGVSIGLPASRIVVVQSGLYQFDVTVQISSSNSNAKTVWLWFRKNGTDIANTARLVTININNGYVPMALAEFFSLAANDYIEIMFATNDTAITVDNVAATAFAPAAPAVVLAVSQIQQ